MAKVHIAKRRMRSNSSAWPAKSILHPMSSRGQNSALPKWQQNRLEPPENGHKHQFGTDHSPSTWQVRLYAPLHALLLDPHLPAWLPEITLSNLRVADAVISLRFYRRDNGSSDYEVLDKRGHLHVVRQPSPWSLTAGFGERVRDAVESLLPGK